MLNWKILYADGSTFSNLDGDHYEAPRQGVQMVFKRDPSTGVTMEPNAYGFWIWNSGEWFAASPDGFWDYLYTYPHPVPLFGRTLPTKEWEGRIKQRIQDEMDIRKSAWRAYERQLS